MHLAEPSVTRRARGDTGGMGATEDVTGLALARAFFHEAVAP